MTEEQIERRVESRTDALDKRLMSSAIDQKTYDAEIAALSRWAEGQYKLARR